MDLISTHAPLAGRDNFISTQWKLGLISTHAPLAGRDCLVRVSTPCQLQISTHAPLAGRDEMAMR